MAELRKAQGGSGDSSRKGRHFVDGNTDGLLIAFVTVVATGSGEEAKYEHVLFVEFRYTVASGNQ